MKARLALGQVVKLGSSRVRVVLARAVPGELLTTWLDAFGLVQSGKLALFASSPARQPVQSRLGRSVLADWWSRV